MLAERLLVIAQDSVTEGAALACAKDVGLDSMEASLLRDYAITNEAEYFAVASEVFFEKPKRLSEALPDVYASLATYYGLDLAERSRNKKAPPLVPLAWPDRHVTIGTR